MIRRSIPPRRILATAAVAVAIQGCVRAIPEGEASHAGADLVLATPAAILAAPTPPPFDVVLRNVSRRSVLVHRLGPSVVHVAQVTADGTRVPCSYAVARSGAGEAALVSLRPGAALTLQVVPSRCPSPRPRREYRLEITYVVPASVTGGRAWTGALGPASVTPTADPAQLAVPDAPRPVGAQLPSSQDLARSRYDPPPAAPAGGAVPVLPPRRAATPRVATPPGLVQGRDPGAFRTCVDSELARRGLNAFGDPPGSVPPRELGRDLDADRRYAWILEHVPAVATACTAGVPFQ